jgi:hypothetical protein
MTVPPWRIIFQIVRYVRCMTIESSASCPLSGTTIGRVWVGLCAFVTLAALGHPRAQTPPRIESRVVFASTRQLARQLDEAGRNGYGCTAVARAEPGVEVPGVAVVLSRQAGASPSPVSYRVVTASGVGTDLQTLLERAGAEGFRLCGVVLDQAATVPAIVAVMSHPADVPSTIWHYGVEALTDYKRSLVSLNTGARNGLLPVAASPINNNRVPEMRSWLVVVEREGDRVVTREIAVRSSSGADGFQRALNEQGAQGYRADLIWKEGNDVVAMMSRETTAPRRAFAYNAESTEPARLHFLHQLYVADVPYLTSGARLVISDRAVAASADVEEDPLPSLGGMGYAGASALAVVGDHITRHHGFAPVSARLGRGSNGSLVLTTIIVQRSQ